MKDNMPKEIYAWMGLQDNGSWDANIDVCTPPATKYHHDSEVKKRDEVIRDLVRSIRDIESECEMEMSRNNHKKKIANMDYHYSEVNHQEGRWNQANDLREYVEKYLTKHADTIKEICDDKI